ncbi:MAG: calcium/sodium antiporter [Candidatus Kapabacteria bacterium]|jgi:cation:H+ antiporter|nr:calcium/sodium antiporter [Candidatus Kapabacteria bacterium]
MPDLFGTNLIVAVIGIIGGTIFLYFGAEGLVRASVSVAFRAGIAPLVVGLTVVAFGTSMPELIVSVSAAVQDKEGMSLGNIIGSNICNIAMIIGIAAIIRPIKVNIKLIRTDISIMIGVTLLLVLMLLDGAIDRGDGILLAGGIVAYNFVTIFLAKKSGGRETDSETEEMKTQSKRKTWIDILFIIGGMGFLVLGAHFFVGGASVIAVHLGASDVIIGLTLLAFGTSLPELATSLVASFKGEGDISIGNAVGSNIFNILSVLGITAIVHPIVVGDSSMSGDVTPVDIGMMILVAIILLPLARTKMTISRKEGFFLLSIYVGYMFYLYTKMGG